VFLTIATTRACGGRLALTLTRTLHRRSGARPAGLYTARPAGFARWPG